MARRGSNRSHLGKHGGWSACGKSIWGGMSATTSWDYVECKGCIEVMGNQERINEFYRERYPWLLHKEKGGKE